MKEIVVFVRAKRINIVSRTHRERGGGGEEEEEARVCINKRFVRKMSDRKAPSRRGVLGGGSGRPAPPRPPGVTSRGLPKPPPASGPPPPPGLAAAHQVAEDNYDNGAESTALHNRRSTRFRAASQVLGDKLRGNADYGRTVTKDELYRRGIFRPDTEKEEKIKSLEAQVAALEASLEQTKARHFRMEQEQKASMAVTAGSASGEIAKQARRINEMRVEHERKLKTLEDDHEKKIIDQVERQRGAVFRRLEQQWNGKVQQQLNNRRGDLYERLMLATQNMVRDDVANRRGIIYTAILETVQDDVAEDFRMRRGELYARVAADIRGAVLKEIHENDQKELIKLSEAENRFHARYHSLVDETNKRTAEMYAQMRAETEELLASHRQSAVQSARRGLEEAEAAWRARWAAREEEWRTGLSNADEARNAENEELLRGFSDSTSRIAHQLEETMRETKEDFRAELEKMVSGIVSGRESFQEELQQLRDAIVGKYETIREQEKAEDVAAKEMIKRQHESQMKSMEASLIAARERYTDGLKQINELHEREIASLRGIIEAEQQRIRGQKTQFEKELQGHYTLLAQSLRQELKEAAETEMVRAVNSLSDHATLEDAKVRFAQEAVRQAEEAAMERFTKLLEDAQERWNAVEGGRRSQMENTMKSQHAMVVDDLQSQLKAALELKDDADSEWRRQAEGMNIRHLETLKQFEAKMRRIYDERLTEHVERTEEQIRSYEEALLRKGAEVAEMKAMLERRVRRAKLATHAWRADYAKHVDGQYRAILQACEEKYLEEIERLCRELAEEREKSAVTLFVHENQAREWQRQRASEAKAYSDRKAVIERDEETKRAGNEELRGLKETLAKLWDGMDANAVDCVPFLVEVMKDCDYSPRILELFKGETSKMAARLPLVKMATRREYIKYRVQCIHRHAKDPGNQEDFGTTTRTQKLRLSEQARDVLLAELALIDSRLRAGMDEFELRHGERFLFRGQGYRSVLDADARVMPEKVHAMGSVVRDPESLSALRSLDATTSSR